MSEEKHEKGASGHGHEATPIIIKKRHGGHHAGHHGGAWKVAYADFVTAMMAFFLVMWLVNQTEEVKQAVGGYFRDPMGSSNTAGAKSSTGQAGVLEAGSKILDSQSGIMELPVAPQPGSMPEKKDEEEKKRKAEEEKARQELNRAAEELRRSLESLDAFEEISQLVQITQTQEGLLIELMEDDDSTFFELGDKQLSPKGVQVVQAIARVIGPLGRDVVLEGHTDSTPFTSKKDYSNWELSADRANSARVLLENDGVDASKVKAIRGYAAQRPRFADNPKDSRNRRVAILVLAQPEAQTDPPPGTTDPIYTPPPETP